MTSSSEPVPAAISLRDRIEAGAVRALLGLFGALPLDLASALGGGLARLVGPRLRAQKVARRNLVRALPELTPEAQRRALTAMWNNLGRTVAEYPHLHRLMARGRVEIDGMAHLDAAVARGKPIIFFSGHIGNWEVASLPNAQRGLALAQVYRAANNPLVDEMLVKLRLSLGHIPIAKGASGARRIFAHMRQGGSLAMLVDQKMNDGISVPFFGREAMTAPAAADLALRFDASLLPTRVQRLDGTAYFRITFYPPVPLAPTGDRLADSKRLMTEINSILEGWIRDEPGNWFWVHRRWPD